jgi:hypothetical protein
VYRRAAQVPGSVLKKLTSAHTAHHVAPAQLKPAAATVPGPRLDSPDRAESKLVLGTVAARGSGYEQAVTS